MERTERTAIHHTAPLHFTIIVDALLCAGVLLSAGHEGVLSASTASALQAGIFLLDGINKKEIQFSSYSLV